MKHQIFRFLYLLCPILFALVLVLALEGIATLFVDLPSRQFTNNFRLNHTWPPGKSSLHFEWVENNPSFSSPYQHQYNAQGWLEAYDIQKKKPKGVYRIFYVGDSFTEGCTPMELSVPSLVEKRLNKAIGEMSFEVINTGTTSYSPLIYSVLIRHFLMEYDPDMIVINVDMTDVEDDALYRETAMFDREGNPWAVPPRSLWSKEKVRLKDGVSQVDWKLRPKLFLYKYSHLYHLLARPKDQEKNIQTQRPGASFAWCQKDWTDQVEKDVFFSVDLLEGIVRYCKKKGVTVVVTGVPHWEQFSGRWSSKPHKVLQDMVQKSGALYLNSYEALKPKIQGTAQNKYYYLGDMHFNPLGNILWAGTHVDFLLKNKADW